MAVSSVEAVRSLPYQSAYAAAKHGVRGMLDALRLEVEHDGARIAITNIMPALIHTLLFDKARTKLGVKPKGIPPVYDPGQVVEALLWAAEHRTRSKVVGGAGQLMVAGQTIAPGLMDYYFLKMGFRGQRTTEPRSVETPNNLFGPVEGLDRVYGEKPEGQRSHALQRWPVDGNRNAQSTSGLQWTALSLLAGAAAALITQKQRSATAVEHRFA